MLDFHFSEAVESTWVVAAQHLHGIPESKGHLGTEFILEGRGTGLQRTAGRGRSGCFERSRSKGSGRSRERNEYEGCLHVLLDPVCCLDSTMLCCLSLGLFDTGSLGSRSIRFILSVFVEEVSFLKSAERCQRDMPHHSIPKHQTYYPYDHILLRPSINRLGSKHVELVTNESSSLLTIHNIKRQSS